MRTAGSHSAVSHSSSHITATPLREWMRLAGLHLAAWVETCARAAAEAAIYRHLSRLSDAELERRGIPRGELHRCIFEGTSDQAGRR
jgi:hypothetical protein